METKPSTSKNFLSFASCRTCRGRPCERLRFGRVYPGKFIFVHTRYLGFTEKDCPFCPVTFDEFRQFASLLPLVDLIWHLEDVFSQLTVAEQLIYTQQLYVYGYDDYDGRLLLLEALWNDSVVGIVRIPPFFLTDKKLATWLLANETLVYAMKQNLKKAKDGSALTDALAEDLTKPISLTNPKWEHVSQDLKEKSPDKAKIGNTILLSADTTNMNAGDTVSFDIYDTAADPEVKLNTVFGTVSSDVASISWTVSRKNLKEPLPPVAIKIDGLESGQDTGDDCIIIKGENGFEKKIKVSEISPDFELKDCPKKFSFSVETGDGTGEVLAAVMFNTAKDAKDDKKEKKDPSLAFVAKAKTKSTSKCTIALAPTPTKAITVSIECDQEIPAIQDRIMLISKDEEFAGEVTMSDAESGAKTAKLELTDAPEDAKFTLRVELEEDGQYSLFENQLLAGEE